MGCMLLYNGGDKRNLDGMKKVIYIILGEKDLSVHSGYTLWPGRAIGKAKPTSPLQ